MFVNIPRHCIVSMLLPFFKPYAEQSILYYMTENRSQRNDVVVPSLKNFSLSILTADILASKFVNAHGVLMND